MSKQYVEKCIELTKKNYPGETEFHQTVEEVLTSLIPVLEQHPEYEKHAILERLIEPERFVSFRVVWVDDAGKVRVNKGYRCQFNSAMNILCRFFSSFPLEGTNTANTSTASSIANT